MKKFIVLLFATLSLLACTKKEVKLTSGYYYGNAGSLGNIVLWLEPSIALFSFGEFGIQSKTRVNTDMVSYIEFKPFTIAHGSMYEGDHYYYYITYAYVNSSIENGLLKVVFKANYYETSKQLDRLQPAKSLQTNVYFLPK